jgi:hypothetical protein
VIDRVLCEESQQFDEVSVASMSYNRQFDQFGLLLKAAALVALLVVGWLLLGWLR